MPSLKHKGFNLQSDPDTEFEHDTPYIFINDETIWQSEYCQGYSLYSFWSLYLNYESILNTALIPCLDLLNEFCSYPVNVNFGYGLEKDIINGKKNIDWAVCCINNETQNIIDSKPNDNDKTQWNEHWNDWKSRYAEFQIISGIFNGKLRFAGTKSQPLIPCGILKDCDPMKRYLINLDSTLNISELKKNGKNINAMQLLELVNKQLTYLTNNSGKIFMKSLKTENISTTSNIRSDNGLSMQYNSYHSSSITPVSEQRYSPLNSLPINVFNFNNEDEYVYEYTNQPQIQMYNSNNFNNLNYNSNRFNISNANNHCCICNGCDKLKNNYNPLILLPFLAILLLLCLYLKMINST